MWNNNTLALIQYHASTHREHKEIIGTGIHYIVPIIFVYKIQLEIVARLTIIVSTDIRKNHYTRG
jgi:hypothetical protein